MSNWSHKIKAKLVSLQKAKTIVSDWKKNGESISFTNGCFDIIHPGHVDYLAKTANFGSKCIIGLNSDDSVRRLGKAIDRPLNNQLDRAYILSAFEFIDLIVIFDEDTPLELMQNLQPNIITKGGDYDANETDKHSKKYVVGRDFMEKTGGKVEIIQFLPGYSTTNLVKKIRK